LNAISYQSKPKVLMKQNPIIISDLTELRKLLIYKHWHERKRHSQIHLEINSLTSVEKTYWLSRLNPPYFDCGCPAGTAALFLGTGGYLAYLFFIKGISSIGWIDLLIGLLVLASSAGIGKVLGIHWARIRFNRSIRKLIAIIEESGQVN